MDGHLGESGAEDRARAGLDLAEKLGVVASARKAEFKAADAGEQAGDLEV